MNLAALLQFLPLIVGAFLAYHFVIKKELPAKSLGSILTYFLGVLIVFLVIAWFISSYLPGWGVNLLSLGTNPGEWRQLIDTSENIVDQAFEQGNPPQPTVVQVQPIIVTATPAPGTSFFGSTPPPTTGTIQYTVLSGDTLTSISQKFGVTVQDIMNTNGLNSDFIKAGDILLIPSRQ